MRCTSGSSLKFAVDRVGMVDSVARRDPASPAPALGAHVVEERHAVRRVSSAVLPVLRL